MPNNNAVNTRQSHEFLAHSEQRRLIFSDDAGDEFRIYRANGEPRGIFKTWAHPAIATLERDNTSEDWATWAEKLRKKPLALYQTLELWRGISETTDRRLQDIFLERSTPTDAKGALVELLLREKVAFALTAPFYNIEAMVSDERLGATDNPIDFSEESLESSGILDTVAMLLPAAFAKEVVAGKLEWKSCDWEYIDKLISKMREAFLCDSESLSARKYSVLLRVAQLASKSPREVIFAANALEFIPVQVGGKRDDMPETEALEVLEEILSTQAKAITTTDIAKDMNALIRFLNWFPSKVSDRNFNGVYWMYDSTCATAAQLIDCLVAHARDVFCQEDARLFIEHYSPQLQNLDAQSAKGRAVLDMFDQGLFVDEVYALYQNELPSFTREILDSLEKVKSDEFVVDSLACRVPYLVGGKSTGLAQAYDVLGRDYIPESFTITSEAIDGWLRSDKQLSKELDRFYKLENREEIVACGKEIQRIISQLPLPPYTVTLIKHVASKWEKFVLRSSAFDEDGSYMGAAPGVYESVTPVTDHDTPSIEQAIKSVVGSFFTEKAIDFRKLRDIRNIPVISVLLQEYLQGINGAVFIDNTGMQLSASSVTGGINENVVGHFHGSSQLPSIAQKDLEFIAERLFDAYGPIDFEFVIDKNDRTHVIQMRTLEHSKQSTEVHSTDTKQSFIVSDSKDLDNFITTEPTRIVIDGAINLGSFQGNILKWLVQNRHAVSEIVVPLATPKTCHFVNVVQSLKIRLEYA